MKGGTAEDVRVIRKGSRGDKADHGYIDCKGKKRKQPVNTSMKRKRGKKT